MTGTRIIQGNSPPAKPLLEAQPGVLFYLSTSDILATPPPLPELNQKLEYLEDNGYFGHRRLNESQAEALSRINFHYFLGYARNYGMLHDRGIFQGDQDPQHVFDLIALDQEVSNHLFDLIRQAELNLRNRTVEFFCSNSAPTSYLDISHLGSHSRDLDERELVAGMLKEIFRYGEDYVIKSLENKATTLGVQKPKRYSPQDHDLCLELASDLPIWAVIDCFSLGQLGKFVMACDTHVEDHAHRTWKQIAKSLDMAAPVFSTGIESLSNTRNLVCHHARLWMRPATHSPKKPRIFSKQLRNVDPKSQLMAFANIAHFQHGTEKRTAFQSILDLVKSNELYRYGISQTSHRAAKNRPSTQDIQ